MESKKLKKLIYVTLILILPAVPVIVFNWHFRDYFLFLFLAFITLYWITTPHKKTTKRGRICTAIQYFSALVAMIVGSSISIFVLESNILIFPLGFGGMIGIPYLLEILYEKMGITNEERSFR